MSNNRMYLMKDAPVKKGLLRLGIPSIIGMLMIGFYNFVDSYFVAQLGTSAMGALSLTFPLMTLMPGIGLLFGSGASALISEYLGAQEEDKANYVLNSSLFYLMIFSLASLLLFLILEDLLLFLGASADVLPYALDYSRILIFSFVFHIPSVALTNLVRAEGASRLSAFSQVLGAIINIVLDPILMFRLNMGIAGAALATAIAQFVSFLVLIQYYFSERSLLKLSLRKIKIKAWIIKPMLLIGFPLFAINLFQSVALSLSNAIAASYGDYVLAAIGIVSRIVTMISLGITGFSRGYQNFAAYNYGAGNKERVAKSTELAYRWTIGAGLLIGLFIILIRKPILQAFSHDPKVLKIASLHLIANALVFFAYSFQAIAIVYLLLIRKNIAGFLFSIARQGLVFIPLLLLMNQVFELQGLLYAQRLADLITSLLLYTYLKSCRKKQACL